MNEAGIAAALKARAQSDTTTGGLYHATAPIVNGFTWVYGGRTAAGFDVDMPYVAFSFVTKPQSDGFTHDLQKFLIDFHVFCGALDDKEAALTQGSGIVDRLYGNALSVNTRIPTYGFHRHRLVLTLTGDTLAPWATGVMYRTGGGEAHEDDLLHYVESYEVNMSRVVAA